METGGHGELFPGCLRISVCQDVSNHLDNDNAIGPCNPSIRGGVTNLFDKESADDDSTGTNRTSGKGWQGIGEFSEKLDSSENRRKLLGRLRQPASCGTCEFGEGRNKRWEGR